MLNKNPAVLVAKRFDDFVAFRHFFSRETHHQSVASRLVTLVFGEDEEMRFLKSTSFSATAREEESLRSLVPA